MRRLLWPFRVKHYLLDDFDGCYDVIIKSDGQMGSKDEELRKRKSCPSKEYNEFRNLARKELGLTAINFSEEKVFLTHVGTVALMKANSNHQHSS